MKLFALILSILSFSTFAEVNLVKVDKSENNRCWLVKEIPNFDSLERLINLNNV